MLGHRVDLPADDLDEHFDIAVVGVDLRAEILAIMRVVAAGAVASSPCWSGAAMVSSGGRHDTR